ncbi:hypothetical protein JK358_21355 [Nocardia sp. 2]|uniref:Uncharacterized protein n=1 Tax=Nocardia acididurans TaxID=2802282 RepID=A0ABS1M8I1_9NOCA|nr:hypothetical protein [Nocardia acididurans]MBL1076947.1 hypothetical protein [Nocardia acididurans]
MTIFYNAGWMSSDLTGEAAHQEGGGCEPQWRLSWLPERLVSRGQAVAGMELAEFFSGNHCQRDVIVAARAIISAAELGIAVGEAMSALQGRRLR